jgi:hypothetical protein
MAPKTKKQQQCDAQLAACLPPARKLLSILQQSTSSSAAVADIQHTLEQLLAEATNSATSGSAGQVAALLDSSRCAKAILAGKHSCKDSSSWLLCSTIDMLYDLCGERPVLCKAFAAAGGCGALLSAAVQADVRCHYNCQLYVTQVLLALPEQPDGVAATAAAGGADWLLEVHEHSPADGTSGTSSSSSNRTSRELYLHKLSQHVQAQLMSLTVLARLGSTARCQCCSNSIWRV